MLIRMKRFSYIVIMFFLFTLLTGCTSDSIEIDDQVYTLIIGCDKAVNNKIRLTVQFPTYKSSGDGNGGGSMQKSGSSDEGKEKGVVGSTLVQTIEASSILEGINLLNTATTRRISFVHTKTIVFSEEMARQGIGNFLEPIARFREARRIMEVIVCKGTAEAFINENKSMIGESVAKTMELSAKQADYSGFYPRATFQDFYKAVISPYEQPYCIYGGLNDFTTLKPLDGTQNGQLRTQDEIEPGQVPRKGNRKIELIGTAVFNGDKMVGSLNSYETRFFLMVTGDYKKGIVTIEDKNSPGEAIPLDVRLGRQPNIKVHFEKGIPIIDVNLNVEADVGAIQSRIQYENLDRINDLNNQLEVIIKEGVEKVIDKTQKQWNTDIFGFGTKVARYFLTVTEFEKYNWKKHYKDARVNVYVGVNVRRTGLMLGSSPVRNNTDTILSGGGK
jgi:germination protein, Ger(x)C family